ncbi:MAG: serine/threonine protein kinase [Phycisphaerae bacterium]|nr:serine/threonine protein kinase [Phycisphaerae bacterium]
MNADNSSQPDSSAKRERELIEAARCQAAAGSDRRGSPFALPPPGALPGYDFIRQICRGGMGIVYEAQQESTGRRVAVKFMLEQSRQPEAARRRFEREVDLVARLQHPGIVSVIDSGVHHGQYYYVMEYVDGQPLDETLPPGECNVRQVLSLIGKICTAVDYAHQHGVLHRDLKPSNILIDDRGEPRLLDFGLAKAFDPDSRGGLEQTLSKPGQLLGTLGYMSPEQSRGQFEVMSVRSDVYSIGAMAYELITGVLPCEIDGALGDVLERIATSDPPRPSTLREKLDADVDAILLKTLEKSPEDRYPTAAALADDIRRFLADQTIVARRAGVATRTVHWVRRNRAVATVIGVGIPLIIVLTTVYLFSLAAQRDTARAEAEKAQQTLGYLENMLATFDPNTAGGVDVAILRHRLREWTRGLGELDSQPEIAAAVRHRIGTNCLRLGLYDEAEELLRTALETRLETLGSEHPDTAATVHSLGRALHKKTNYAEAERLYRQALQVRIEVYGEEHPTVAESLSDLAWLLKDAGDLAAAEPLYRQALAMRRRLYGNEHADVADSLNKLAQFLRQTGRPAEAEQHFREALAMRLRLHSPQHTEAATSMANLGDFLRSRGEFDEALPLLRDALEIRRELLGEHATTVVSQNLLALLLRDMGNYSESEDLFREALRLRLKLLGEEHEFVAVSQHNLASVLHARGKFAEAEPLYRAALGLLSRLLPDDHYKVASGRLHLADLLREMGQYEEAEQLCRRALHIREKIFSEQDDHPAIAAARLTLGWILFDRGDLAGAEPLLRDAVDVFQARYPEPHWPTARAQSTLGACLTARKRYEEAEPLLTHAYEVIAAKLGAKSRYASEAHQRVIELHEAWGKPQ